METSVLTELSQKNQSQPTPTFSLDDALDLVLENEPDNAIAHLIMGMNFDTWAANQPTAPASAYQLAAEIATKNGDLSIAFTAAFLQAKMFLNSGQKQKSAAVAREILTDYPKIESARLKSWVREIADGG